MRRLPLIGSLVIALVVLAGCTTTPAQPAVTDDAAPTPTSSTAGPSQTPDAEGMLVITLDGLDLESAAADETAAYSDPAAVLALVEEIAGAAPQVQRDEQYGVTFYDWPGVRVLVRDGGPASVAVSSAELAGVPVVAGDGLAVGMPRQEARAAGAWEGADADGDGDPDFLGFGERDVPGTVSLTDPSRTGIQFVLLMTDDDEVTEIQSPSNDFADV